ncbi:hypothetical protein E6P78_18520 [Streptomyces sp. A0958]|uniref:hypothetical protein n=1 Tax=Streptomyces sp. A0958 TaxID=2563101 RepID=UPI00109E4697|nr:hypothetical protein [Streptomyces sp. A0958]THA65282.1 hypothetical protein E6P78_18520 [Streptomyces sp. A0958]
MLRLDAPQRGISSLAISNHGYTESECGYSGPGWSWMWVPAPFSSQFVQAQFTDRVFKKYRTCQKDLRAFVRENLAENSPRWSKRAAAVLRDNTAQEFVLVCSSQWVAAAYEVRSGGSAEAGTAFYNGWVDAVNADPGIAYTLMASGEPVLIAPS